MTDEQQLRTRAAKRWRWRLIVLGAVGGVVGPLLGNVLSDHDRGPIVEKLAGAAVGAVVVVGAFVLITRRWPRFLTGDGFFAAPLSMGLSWKQRRAATRAVRRVRPSADPVIRSAERDLAQRSVRQRARSGAVFGLTVLLLVVLAAFGDLTVAGRIYFLAAATLSLGLAVWSQFFAHQALAYLDLHKIDWDGQ